MTMSRMVKSGRLKVSGQCARSSRLSSVWRSTCSCSSIIRYPTSKFFDRSKSEIPVRHERLIAAALPEDGRSSGTTWWAYCEHKFFHRFKGGLRDNRPLVHWNGTTNEYAKQNRDPDLAHTTEDLVPVDLREKLLSQRVEGCGCREIRQRASSS